MAVPIHVFHAHDRLAALVRRAAVGREVIELSTPDKLARAIADIEVLFAPVPPRSGWQSAQRLRLIQLAGAGADHLLPSPDLPARVKIASLSGLFADEAAEHAMAMMLALARDLPAQIDRQRRKSWEQLEAGKLAGRSIGILGLGEIGRRIARRAAAFDMLVVGMSRRASPVPFVDEVYPPDRMNELLACADYLVITLPLTDATRNLVDARALALLPRGARVIHFSRGGVIDERALLDALRSGALAGAAIDVFDREPLERDSPFWDAPNTIVTAHVAGFGEHYLERAVTVLMDNVGRLERNEPIEHLIDREAGY